MEHMVMIHVKSFFLSFCELNTFTIIVQDNCAIMQHIHGVNCHNAQHIKQLMDFLF